MCAAPRLGGNDAPLFIFTHSLYLGIKVYVQSNRSINNERCNHYPFYAAIPLCNPLDPRAPRPEKWAFFMWIYTFNDEKHRKRLRFLCRVYWKISHSTQHPFFGTHRSLMEFPTLSTLPLIWRFFIESFYHKIAFHPFRESQKIIWEIAVFLG